MARRLTAGIGALAVVFAACGGSGGSTTTDSTSAPTSTVAATTTTTASTLAPTTTAAVVEVYPLTGLPVTDDAAAERPAMVVKIDNHPGARPQSGLNAADIVFEEIVESGTRFAAVFHSGGSDPVGPIRSGRTQDVDLLGSFNRPLFVWSGGNRGVTRAISKSDLVDLSAQHNDVYSGGGFYRDRSYRAPHDLFAQTSMLWTLAPADAGPPPQQFQYLAEGEQPDGETASGVDLTMDGSRIAWRFDRVTGRYLRAAGEQPHEDAATGQITTDNVVVMVVRYRASAADSNSPEAQTIGEGEVYVFTGGVVIRGTWSRGDRLSPVVLTDENGEVIALRPGRTWVELARADSFTIAD